MGKIVALYDIMGIQDFIFSSNKLKENVGASIIVQRIFNDFFIDKDGKSLKTVCPKKIIYKWWEIPGLEILKNHEIEAEVVYIGGGNAMVAFQDTKIFNKVNRELSKKILEKTGGTLHFAAAPTEIGTDFEKDKKHLFEKLKKNKYETYRTFPLPGIAVTREGITDGLPAQKLKDKEFISFSANEKREEQEKSTYFEERLLEGDCKSSYIFPREFDDLGQREGENHIAVVHIDGNNMGKMINQRLKGITDYDTAVKKMKQFSKEVSETYETVMKWLVKRLINAIKDETFIKKLNLHFQKKPTPLFIRPLVLDGDDVTFVVDGRIGIPTAAAFLNQISKEKITIDKEEIPLSACAGVAVVKSHFPFYRAYQLAEELCRSAKMKGKIIAQKKGKEDEVGNWLDFHIVHSGVTTELRELRRKNYNVPGMKLLDPLQYEEHGSVLMRLNQYHLLWRPWCTAGHVEEQCKWEHFKHIFNEFNDMDKWPRSRLKRLRNESIKSETDVQLLLSEFKSRKKPLPLFDGNNEYFREHRCPYFDALELLDFYIEIPGMEDAT